MRFVLSVLILSVGCARGTPPVPGSTYEEGHSTKTALTGRLLYEARHPTLQGASEELERRPARFVDLEVLDQLGEVLAKGKTDADGRFELPHPTGTSKLAIVARIKTDDHHVEVTHDIDGRSVHRFERALKTLDISNPIEIIATDAEPAGSAGALHILDTMMIGLEAAERWTHREMPPIFVYWGRGLTQSWSYYRGERPRGSGRYGFELLGGQQGQQNTTDTDEHDEAIMVHELGHMVMDLVSTDSSLGGRHPPGAFVDPGLAWEEGRVSWFAVAVLNNPSYQDTIGIQPQGKLRVNRDYSRVNAGPQGVGSEQTVGEVLWDLADGAGGIEDADNDGVALGPEGMMSAMMALTDVDGSFPCISSFLRFLVDTGRIGELELKQMLERTGQDVNLLPSRNDDGWPTDLTIPTKVAGSIDGLSNPALSGGPALPSTGYDATKAYRVQISSPRTIEISLSIAGSGGASDRSDLDIELCDIRGQVLGQARTEGRIERIVTASLQPGWYIIYVRDGGEGNRASYTLGID